MRNRVFISFALICAFFVGACTASRPLAHVIVFNDSDKEIPLTLSISDKKSNRAPRTFTSTIKPGIQELAPEKFAKGMYAISATTHEGTVSSQKPLSLDADRWVIINYTQGDSLNIQKKYGFVDTAVLKKINGKYTGIDMYSDNRRPVNL